MTHPAKVSNASAIDLLRYHRSLLADAHRTSAYAAAIARSVRAGDTVIDVGCGSGILTLFACRAGARRVYAIEELPVIDLARELVVANGFADRVVFIHGPSRDATIEEKADVIVTETMGNNGFDEQIASTTAHAVSSWLKPDGVLMPRAIEVYAAPVELPSLADERSFWSRDVYGFDFSVVAERAANGFYPIAVRELLASAARITRVELGTSAACAVQGEARWQVARDARVDGIAVWFRAELTPEVWITNDPLAPDSCRSWLQSVFPVTPAPHVTAGEELRFDLRTFDGLEWRWRVEHGGVTADHTTMRGFPFARRA